MRGWPVIGAIKSIDRSERGIYDNSAGNQRRRSMVAHLFSKLSIPSSLFLATLSVYPSLSLLGRPLTTLATLPSLSLPPIGHHASRLLGGRLPLATMHNTPVHPSISLHILFSSSSLLHQFVSLNNYSYFYEITAPFTRKIGKEIGHGGVYVKMRSFIL